MESIFKKNDFNIEKRIIPYPGLKWNLTEWKITCKKDSLIDPKFTTAEEVLNNVRIMIATTPYKSLEVINVDSQDEYNKYLPNKIIYDVGALQIDQSMEIGSVVRFEWKAKKEKDSVIHLTSHDLLDKKYHDLIPDVYLLLVKNNKAITVDAKVVES